MKKGDAIILTLTVSMLVLRLAGFNFIVILTNSMEPTIYPGSLVVTAPPNIVRPHTGSIILYTVELGGRNFTIMHRIIGEFERNGTVYFATKGDNRRFPDQWFVPEKNVKGVYLFSVRYVGYALIIPMTHYKIYSLVVVFTSFTVASYLLLRDAVLTRRLRSVKKGKVVREALRTARVKKITGRVRR